MNPSNLPALVVIRVDPGPDASIHVKPGTEIFHEYSEADRGYLWVCPNDQELQTLLNGPKGCRPLEPGPTPYFWGADADDAVAWLRGVGLVPTIVFIEEYDPDQDEEGAIY